MIVWWRYNNPDMNGGQYSMKVLKERNKIKGLKDKELADTWGILIHQKDV